MGIRIDFSRLHDRFIALIHKELKPVGEMTQQEFADKIGVNRTHLNLVLNKNPQRPLTRVMIEKCVEKGIFNVDQIYDGKATSKEEIDFWGELEVSERKELKKLLYEVEQAGNMATLIPVMRALATKKAEKK